MKNQMRFIGVLAVVLLTAAGCKDRATETAAVISETSQQAEADLPAPGRPEVGRRPETPAPVRRKSVDEYTVTTWVSGLEIPWDIAFVSETRAYVTERPGRVRLVEDGLLRPEPYAKLDVEAIGEGGLMGISLHPSYPDPPWVYLMYTYREGGRLYNRVSRFTDTKNGLAEEKAIVTHIPAAAIHDGGIIRFGPDRMLYIGTGDAGVPERAQDLSSPNGKILRVTPEGNPAPGNPFPNSPVWALGFRNVQGLAWNPNTGDLWATNHGPSGEFGLNAMDSVYIVRKGGNHGWPRVLGVTSRRGIESPVLFFPEPGVPPAGASFYSGRPMPELHGNFFFASLGAEHLERVVLAGNRKIERIERWWETGVRRGRYGRLRAVVQGPDGALYVSTSNRDGRGQVRSGDDRILRIAPR